MPGNRPSHVHRILHRLGHSQRTVDRYDRTDDRGGTATFQALRVTKLLADDGELTEGRVEDPVPEIGVIVEHEAEDRREQQQQREQRQEAVVRDERRKVHPLVVEELVADSQRKPDHRVAALERIDPRDRTHSTILVRRRTVVLVAHRRRSEFLYGRGRPHSACRPTQPRPARSRRNRIRRPPRTPPASTAPPANKWPVRRDAPLSRVLCGHPVRQNMMARIRGSRQRLSAPRTRRRERPKLAARDVVSSEREVARRPPEPGALAGVSEGRLPAARNASSTRR